MNIKTKRVEAAARAMACVFSNGGDPDAPAIRWNGSSMEPQEFPAWHDYRAEAVVVVERISDALHDDDDYTLCDCCGSYAESTADDDGEGNPLGHVQCAQCSRIAELEAAQQQARRDVHQASEALDAAVNGDADALRSVRLRLHQIAKGTR